MEGVFESIARSCLGPAYASIQPLQQAATAAAASTTTAGTTAGIKA